MKKLIAMLLALTTAVGVAVTAMAQTSAVDTETSSYTVAYDKDKNGVTLIPETVLAPNETYYFPVRIAEKGGEAKDMTVEQFKNLKFSFAAEEGKGAVESIKIEKNKSRYSLALKTRVPSLTEVSEVSYTVRVVDKTTNSEAATTELSFQVGYPSLPEHSISNPNYVEVDPKTPVVTTEQFKELDEMSDGDAVTLAYGDWEYAVKVRGMKNTNLHTEADDIDAILERYPNQEFKFVTFTYGPTFRTEGVLSVDVSDDIDLYGGKFYVYMYDRGRLVPMNAKLNEEKALLEIPAKQLGRFVITNKAISQLAVEGGSNAENGSSNGNAGSGNTDSAGPNGTEPNPGTGAA